MLRLIAKRLAAAVVIVLVLTAVLFLLQHTSTADPVRAMLGANASQAAVAAKRAELGLDDPISVQYWHYVTGLLHGDLGTSYRTRREVSADIGDFLPATVELAFYGLLLAVVLGVLFAVATTLRWPGARVFRFVLMAGAAAPVFLLGIGGIVLFYKTLGWLPATGRTSLPDAPTGPTGLLTLDAVLHGRVDVLGDALQHLVLPALAVAIGPAVAIGRVLQTSLGSTLHTDYTRTARAKGLAETAVMRKHVLRNSLGPALSMTGLQVGLMFAGVLVVELIFSWPGLGQYTAQSIPVDDFPAIAGVMLLLGVAYVLINAVVDLLQAAADPRIEA